MPWVFLNTSQFYLILQKCWNWVFWLFHIFSSPFILAEASHKIWSATVNTFRPLRFSVNFFIWKSSVNTFFPPKKSPAGRHRTDELPSKAAARRVPTLPLATATWFNSGSDGAAGKPCGPTVFSAQRQGNPLCAKYGAWQETRGSVRTLPLQRPPHIHHTWKHRRL